MTSPRLRVGIDFHTYDGIYQGSRSHILGLYKAAITMAPDIEFFFFLENIENLKLEHPEFSSKNVQLIKTKNRSGLIRFALQLSLLQLSHKLDLLHTQYRIPLIPLAPCACTIHDILFESHPEYFKKTFSLQSKLTFRLAARASKLLFTVSNFSKNEIEDKYGIPSDKIQVTHNGVDFRRFYPGTDGATDVIKLGLTPNNYILTIGRLEPRKNHARLIEAYSKSGNHLPPLVCIGQRDFNYDQAILSAKTFGVENRVYFLENIDDAVLPALIRNSSLFIFPSIAEGFGMPVLEALASGVPVITSNTTSLPEVAGEAAILVNPLCIDSISTGIKKLLNDTDLISNLKISGPIQAQKFDWHRSAEILINSYRQFQSQSNQASKKTKH